MPKIKAPRTAPSLDMTPMVDLAFLLVTFFMLTAKFRSEEAVVVDIPSSISEKLLPENVMLVTIDTAGRVFYNLEGQDVRRSLLMKMGEKYKVEFDEKEIKKFQLMTMVGMPMQDLKKYINESEANRVKMDKQTTGIPTDSLNNELGAWIAFGYVEKARNEQALKVANDKRLRFAIKADGGADYKKVQKVIKIFQDNKVNTFNLITNLEKEQ
jgi:biopolymer transport protein ExbD